MASMSVNLYAIFPSQKILKILVSTGCTLPNLYKPLLYTTIPAENHDIYQ